MGTLNVYEALHLTSSMQDDRKWSTPEMLMLIEKRSSRMTGFLIGWYVK